MTLTLRNASAVIDHHHTARPATQRYTRTWHHASQLTPGDLWRPDPDRAPHTVTEVHRTRGTWNTPDQVTLVDQYAHAYSYRPAELVATAIPDPLTAVVVVAMSRESGR